MSLSDCSKCWDTPCTCGHEYREMPIDRLRLVREAVNRVWDERAAQPATAPRPTAPRFKEGDEIEDVHHRWKYQLYDVHNDSRGAHACYVVIGGDHDQWDSKVQGFFPFDQYQLLNKGAK